ncbi:MAG: hypothetical protein JO128_10375 [Alphaproteobacteria bacterium]|nr:hypothetical protein [Alphaproteobacteria bacterium]
MASALHPARAIWAALVTAGAAAPAAGVAQSPIDVPTLVTIAPPAEAPSPNAPRSSFDYEGVLRPWDVPRAPWNGPAGALAAATTASTPSHATAFTGAATPLACRQPAYRIILDTRSDMKAGTLCVLPDGSWLLLP